MNPAAMAPTVGISSRAAMQTWGMPLHQQPVVVAGGVVEHGRDGPVDRWLLPNVWTLHVYDYNARLRLDGADHRIRPGSAGIIPPGVQQEYRYRGISRHVFVHLALPARGVLVPVPVLADLGEGHRDFRIRLEAVAHEAATRPLRSGVRLWDLLWELARLAAAAAPPETGNPRLGTAMELIEQGLGNSLPVATLAGRVGLSHNGLTRLFRSHLGSTVVGYIRRRRVERAIRLLVGSALPLRQIAGQIGIHDPQMLNKMVRAVTGLPPSHFRRRAILNRDGEK